MVWKTLTSHPCQAHFIHITRGADWKLTGLEGLPMKESAILDGQITSEARSKSLMR
jgi:hypothetical protein